MRKSLIFAALFAAASATPLIAQSTEGHGRGGWNRDRGGAGAESPRAQPQDRGGPVYQRGGGGRDGEQGGGGWRGNRSAPVVQQQAPQAQPPAQAAPAPAPAQQRSWQGGGWRGQQNNVQGDQGRRVPGGDRPAWRGADRRQGDQAQGGTVQAPPAPERPRADGGWTRNGQGNWTNGQNRQQFRGNDWNRDGNRGDRNWNGQGDRGRSDQWRNPGNSGAQNWNRDWRRDQRYDWQRYRTSNRNLYRAPRYYAPYGYGYGYQRFSIGIYLGNPFFAEQYWLDDPYDYRLPPVDGPYRWVRYYDDVLLVDIRNGYVVDVIHDFFW